MSDFCKQIPMQEYQKCFDILNSGKINKPETYRQFLVSVFEVAKNQMGCQDCGFEFSRQERESFGKASELENIIRLNLVNTSPRYICQNVSTIYHELAHICQNKTRSKKQLGFAKPNCFPFDEAINPYILDKDLLGVHPFLIYYCSQIEKQARDVGYGEANAFFETIEKLSEQQSAKRQTKKIVQKSKKFFEKRMDYEQVHYGIAYEAVEKFIFENPDFVEKALDKIFLEFISEASKTMPYSNDRLQLEKTVAARICALSSLGCNDKCKNKIIDFVTQKLVNKKCAVMGIIYVIDSPYAKITKQDFELLFDYARDSGDFNKDLFKCLYNWKKEDVVVLVKEYVAKTKMQQKYQNIKKMEEKENQENCQKQQEECQIY